MYVLNGIKHLRLPATVKLQYLGTYLHTYLQDFDKSILPSVWSSRNRISELYSEKPLWYLSIHFICKSSWNPQINSPSKGEYHDIAIHLPIYLAAYITSQACRWTLPIENFIQYLRLKRELFIYSLLYLPFIPFVLWPLLFYFFR